MIKENSFLKNNLLSHMTFLKINNRCELNYSC